MGGWGGPCNCKDRSRKSCTYKVFVVTNQKHRKQRLISIIVFPSIADDMWAKVCRNWGLAVCGFCGKAAPEGEVRGWVGGEQPWRGAGVQERGDRREYVIAGVPCVIHLCRREKLQKL